MWVGMPTTGKALGPKGRFGPSFYLSSWLDNAFLYIRIGIILAAPFMAALFFSIKTGLVIFAIEVLSYNIGCIAGEFDRWWNVYDKDSEEEKEVEKLNLSELDKVIERLNYFEHKYYINTHGLFRLLEDKVAPSVINNLDWLEIVSLLNQLSLSVGKHFKRD